MSNRTGRKWSLRQNTKQLRHDSKVSGTRLTPHQSLNLKISQDLKHSKWIHVHVYVCSFNFVTDHGAQSAYVHQAQKGSNPHTIRSSAILSDRRVVINRTHPRAKMGENLIFVVPSIMLYSSEISPTRCNNCIFILRNGFTLHVSGDNLTHHEYVCCIWPQVSRLT